MGHIKAKIEYGFEQSGHFFHRHPVGALIVLLAFICALALQIPRITVDTSAEALLHKNDPDRQDFNKFRDQFGRAEVVIVAARADNIFTLDFLERLRDLTRDLEENTPYVREVTSLVNIRNTRGEADELIVEDLTEDWPETPGDLALLRKRVMESHLYPRYVVSQDLKTAAIIVETEALVPVKQEADESQDAPEEAPLDSLDAFDANFGLSGEQGQAAPVELRYFSEKENEEVVRAVSAILKSHQAPGFDLVFSGGPAIQDVFDNLVLHDTRLCMLLALIANIFLLAVIFRRVSGVFLPVFIVLAALLCTMGLFPLFGVPFKLTATIIPAFLVAVGVADSVHILAIFYRRLGEGASKEDAICHALGHSGLAIVMTSLTTAAGLLSFSFAELTALAELGIFAAVGVTLALIFTLTMLPAMLALFPIKAGRPQTRRTMLMDRFLLFFANKSTARPWLVVGISTALLLVPAYFLPKLVFSDNVVSYFPDGMEVKQNILDLDERLDGVIAVEAVADFGRPLALYEPETLRKLDRFTTMVEKVRMDNLYVGKTTSILDVLKETHQALNENKPGFYRLPPTREAVAQELLLFENSGSDDLERLVDTQFSKARITFKTPWADSVVYEAFNEQIREDFEALFGDSASITVTGEAALMAKTIPAALRSMTKSYGIAFVVITIMMILLVGHAKTGIISMFPNLLPIVLVMGVLSWIGVTLNLNTLMIGSIAIGLVVDDTMHFMYNFRRFFDQGHGPRKSVQLTLLGTGRALLITSLVLCAGFSVLLAATLRTSIQFGVFTAIIILLALLADFVLAPALMVLLTKKETARRQAAGKGSHA